MNPPNEVTSTAGHAEARRSIPAQVVELTAQRLRVMADPTRICLLEALNSGEAGVQELADLLGVSHQTTSHHLNVLWRSGLLVRRRVGKVAVYSVSDWSAWWLIEQIARWVQSCQGGLDASASSP